MSFQKRNTRRFRGKRGSKKIHRGAGSSLKDLGLAGSLVGASALTQGTELQPGSFQEQAQADLLLGGGGGGGGGGRGRGKTRKPGCANDIAVHIVSFLELLNTVKIYHWSTLSYATHKATDELHGKLSELVDSFIEIYIGHCSRQGHGGPGSGVPVFRFPSGKSASIPFRECKSIDAFRKVLDDNIAHLEGMTDSLNGYTDLVNIRDEMVGALAQALYLCELA